MESSDQMPSRVDRVEGRFNAASAIPHRTAYLQLSTTLTYSFLFTLPLFVLYELGTWLLGVTGGGGLRLSADVWIRQTLALLGLGGTFWLGALVVVIGVVILAVERRKGIELRGRYFALMLLESTAYAVVVGMLVSQVVTAFVGSAAMPALQVAGGGTLVDGLVLSVGAGLYEELIFRLVLVTGLFALLGIVPLSPRVRYIIAAVVGAIIFSWVHYLGPAAYPFTVESFLFRALMGLALNVLFLLRGFGIAAMTHSVYDVLVTVMASVAAGP